MTIPLNIAPKLQAYLTASVPLDKVEIIAAKLLAAPPSFEQRSRPIQINGQLLKLDIDGKIDLRTAAGNVSLKLDAPSQEALLSLKNILANTANGSGAKNRALITMLIQPDQPKDATLIVPKDHKLNILRTPLGTNGESKLGAQKEVNFAQGGKLTLTVLPDKIEKSILAQNIQTEPALLSKTSEQAVEKAFGNLQKTVEALTQKNDGTKDVAQVSSQKALSAGHNTGALKQGQELHAKIDRVIAHLKEEAGVQSTPTKTAPQISDKLAPNQIRATVVGKSHSNHVILNTGEKTLFVKQEGHLPTGTKLILSLAPSDAAGEKMPAIPSDREWPALRELISALTQSNPRVTEHFLQSKIPSPTQSMAGATLFFVAALQAGKLNEWLGLPVHMSLIKENKKELVDKLMADLSDGTSTASDARAGEWKACPIPLHNDQSFEMLRLYVRNHNARDQNNTSAEEKKKSHFVITMNMSRLGPVQMEGYSRPKQLDLIIRSERTLPTELPRSIRQGYIKTMEALGMTGTVAFQTGDKDWVRIEDSHMKESEFVL